MFKADDMYHENSWKFFLGASHAQGMDRGFLTPPPPNPIFVFDAVLKIVDSCAGLKEPYQIADQAVAIL